MNLKDLEKIKLLETALLIAVPFGMIIASRNQEMGRETLNYAENLARQLPENLMLYTWIASIPRLVDGIISAKTEPMAKDYKEIKKLYDNIITNLANFLKKENITDPVEIFVIYQFMYRNGYLSYNHNFNYDINMKDLTKLNGADVVKGTGVCRSIATFLQTTSIPRSHFK